MTEFKMIVDNCQTASKNIQSSYDQIDSQVQSINTLVSNLVGQDWIAPSADQFKQEMTEWGDKVKQLLADLSDLKNRFDVEINQWIDTSAKFG